MITKKKIRKVFPPLTITMSTTTAGSATQVYKSMKNQWTPDRTTESFVIYPHCMVTTDASDTTWTNGDYVSKLTSVQWYANGVAIQDTSLNGYFTVGSGVGNNGVLTVTKNLAPSEHYDLVMQAVLHDGRVNQNITVHTDPIQLSVSERTADEWDLSVVHDTAVRYYPLLDKLKEYDWKVEHGKISASEAEKRKCYDGNQYDISMPIIISRGNSVIEDTDRDWSKCVIKSYIIDNGIAYEYGVGTAQQLSFITELTNKKLGVDLRLVPGGTVLEIVLEVDGIKMAEEFLTFSTIINDYTCEPTNEGDLDPNATYRYDRALCTCNGKIMQYPEAYLDIKWYTNTSNKSAVVQGSGEKVSISIEDAQIGTADDCWMEVYIESFVKALKAVITTDDGKAYLVNDKNQPITADMLVN